jgi:hypothetical protein
MITICCHAIPSRSILKYRRNLYSQRCVKCNRGRMQPGAPYVSLIRNLNNRFVAKKGELRL